MEFVIAFVLIMVVMVIAFYCMQESDETRRRKEHAAACIRQMQREREVYVEREFERQRHKHMTPRSAPVTTGVPKSHVAPKMHLNRHDNSFDEVVDIGWAWTYHSPIKTSSYCDTGSGSSSSDSGDSSGGGDSGGGGGCD